MKMVFWGFLTCPCCNFFFKYEDILGKLHLKLNLFSQIAFSPQQLLIFGHIVEVKVFKMSHSDLGVAIPPPVG